MKRVLSFVKWVILFIVLVCISVIVYVRFTRLGDQLMYEVNGLNYDTYTSNYTYEEFYYHIEDEVTLHGVLFKPDTTEIIGTIFHFPGGGMHIPNSESLYQPLLDKGYQIFNYERRGLGKSTGVADNSNVLLEDALTIFDIVLEYPTVKNKPIVVWGQSMGGPYATSVMEAYSNSINGLLLEGTFPSFPAIGKDYASALHLENFTWMIPLIMPNDFPAEKAIQDIEKPIVIVHSSKDETVSYKHGEKLYDAIGDKKNAELWTVDSKHLQVLFDYETVYISKFEKLFNN